MYSNNKEYDSNKNAHLKFYQIYNRWTLASAFDKYEKEAQ